MKPKGLRDSTAARQIIWDLYERKAREAKTQSQGGKNMEAQTMREAFPSAYLAAPDLDGKSVTLTISGHRMHQFNENEKHKLILAFSDNDKEFVCNVTNGNMIEKLTGTHVFVKWYGTPIVLKSEMVQGPKGIGPALRVQFEPSVVAAAPQDQDLPPEAA